MAQVLWHSEDGTYTVQAKLSNQSCLCQIFQQETAEVQFPDLPLLWPTRNNGSFHTVSLRCGHQFSVSALAFHFLNQDMRCPICRDGHHGKMTLESLPPSARLAFSRKLDTVFDSDEDLILTDIEFETHDFEQHLRLQVLVGEEMVESQRLQKEDNDAEDFNTYHVQRCFQRRLQTCLKSAASNVVCVVLKHPLFPHPVKSNRVALRDVTAHTSFVLQTCIQGHQIVMGLVQLKSPIHVRLRTNAVLEMCLQAIQLTLLQQANTQ